MINHALSVNVCHEDTRTTEQNMEKSSIDKGQDGVLDKIEALLIEENNGEPVGFVLVTVKTRQDENGKDHSKLTTMSNMGEAQLPRLMQSVTNDLVMPALDGYEKTIDLIEVLEAKAAKVIKAKAVEDA